MKRVIVAISVVLLVVGGGVGLALASNWADFTAGSNSTVTFSMYSLTDTVHDGYHWSDSNNIDSTDITTINYQSTSGKEVETGQSQSPGT